MGLNDGVDKVLGNLAVIGKQLLGVFGQAVGAVTEAGVVVQVADTRDHADAVYVLPGVQSRPCVAKQVSSLLKYSTRIAR